MKINKFYNYRKSIECRLGRTAAVCALTLGLTLALMLPAVDAPAQIIVLPNAEVPDWLAVRDDGTGPQATGIGAAFTDARTMRISWQTNVPTISIVEYATNAQFKADDTYHFSSYQENTTPESLHVATLVNLIPGETYYYRIRSIDKDLVETISSVSSLAPAVGTPLPSSVIAVSPQQGSVVDATETFSWNAVAGATSYRACLGSKIGAADIYSCVDGVATSVTIENIPTDGRDLFLRLSYQLGASWNSVDFPYKAKLLDDATTLPTLSFTAAPNPVSCGSAAKLNWSSTKAVGCAAFGGWTGVKPINGFASTGAILSQKVFTLTCSNNVGDVSKSLVIRCVNISTSSAAAYLPY